MVVLLARWRPPRRLVLYPLILAGIMYLWDHSLPPPSLPDGAIRHMLPRLVFVWLVADIVMAVWTRRHAAYPATHAGLEYIALDDVAALLGTDSATLRRYAQRAGWPIMLDAAGRPYLARTDLAALVDDWTRHHDARPPT
jgi:hypothetical protein